MIRCKDCLLLYPSFSSIKKTMQKIDLLQTTLNQRKGSHNNIPFLQLFKSYKYKITHNIKDGVFKIGLPQTKYSRAFLFGCQLVLRNLHSFERLNICPMKSINYYIENMHFYSLYNLSFVKFTSRIALKTSSRYLL